MKHTKSFPERNPHFYQVITAVFINKAPTGIIAVACKAGIVIDPGKRIYLFM
jgi:hypothetical protein